MIHHRVRPVIPVLRGFLILATLLLFLPVQEAGAYVPPPVPEPFEAEGDGDDFYCRFQSEPAGPDALRPAGEESGRTHASPPERHEAQAWDAPETEGAFPIWVRVARCVLYLPVMRGF